MSPAAHSVAPSMSPAYSQTGDDNPAKKRRCQVESSAAAAAAPMTTPASPQAAQAGSAKKQRTAAPAKKRPAKRSTETHSPLPELSPAEIAQAEDDGLVFARVGNYAAWPAQVPFTLALPRSAGSLECRSMYGSSQHQTNSEFDLIIMLGLQHCIRAMEMCSGAVVASRKDACSALCCDMSSKTTSTRIRPLDIA